jgi:hypothetical protein
MPAPTMTVSARDLTPRSVSRRVAQGTQVLQMQQLRRLITSTRQPDACDVRLVCGTPRRRSDETQDGKANQRAPGWRHHDDRRAGGGARCPGRAPRRSRGYVFAISSGSRRTAERRRRHDLQRMDPHERVEDEVHDLRYPSIDLYGKRGRPIPTTVKQDLSRANTGACARRSATFLTSYSDVLRHAAHAQHRPSCRSRRPGSRSPCSSRRSWARAADSSTCRPSGPGSITHEAAAPVSVPSASRAAPRGR